MKCGIEADTYLRIAPYEKQEHTKWGIYIYIYQMKDVLYMIITGIQEGRVATNKIRESFKGRC